MGREAQAIGLIGFGHFLSHLYQLVLVPLIEFVRADYGISYVEFGFAAAVYATATASLQTPVGILVDRIGGRWILIAGLFLNGAAIAGMGLASDYWLFLLLAALAGAGNSVFHPADYSLLSASIDKSRLGRAYSIHSFGGTTGFMVAPPLMLYLTALWDWRAAMVFVGLVGVALAIVIALLGGSIREENASAPAEDAETKRERLGWRVVANRPIVMFFVFFIVTACAGSGLSTFTIPALNQLYGIAEQDGAWILTLFYATIAGGVLLGGVIADRVRKHDIVLLVTYSTSALFLAIIGFGVLPGLAVVGAFVIAGLMRGIVNPSRDVLVRRAAPPGSLGAVFGFVTTGFSIGQVIGPIIYGVMMDEGAPSMVFLLAAGFTVIAIVIVLFSRERGLYAKE